MDREGFHNLYWIVHVRMSFYTQFFKIYSTQKNWQMCLDNINNIRIAVNRCCRNFVEFNNCIKRTHYLTIAVGWLKHSIRTLKTCLSLPMTKPFKKRYITRHCRQKKKSYWVLCVLYFEQMMHFGFRIILRSKKKKKQTDQI